MIRTMTETAPPVGRADAALAVVISLLGLMMIKDSIVAQDASVLAAPLFLAVTVPVLWRRRAPLPALAAVLTALLVHAALFGVMTRCGLALPVVFLLAFSVAGRTDGSAAWLGLALALACVLAICATDDGADMSTLPFFAPLTAAIWWIGRVVRQRGAMAGQLQERNAELRAARDERARLEVAADRARLSAELDELLRRRLAELVRLADAGARGDAADPVTALSDIEHQSRRTLEEMRSVVGLLRDGDEDVPVAPQPALAHLEALIVREKGAGARLAVEGVPRVLPAGVELSAYRVVEHLLGALEDAPDVDVRVRFADDAIELAISGRVRGDARPAIERARERVQLHHGTLDAKVRRGRAEALVSLPVAVGG